MLLSTELRNLYNKVMFGWVIVDFQYFAWGFVCSPVALETWVQSQVESYQRLKKMVLDASLFNPQHYKVRLKGKVEQSRGKGSTLSYT